MAKNSIRSMFQVPSRAPDARQDISEPRERKSRPASSSMGKDAEIALLNARVVELEKSSVVELRIDSLVIDPERRRTRSPEKYEQLKELIKMQGQTDPIKVFRREDGRVEVFEGHNRIQILTEFGKETVKAIFLEGFDVIEAEKLAVTSNSVQSESSTFYVYSAAKRLMGLGLDEEEVSDLLGIKHVTLQQFLRIGLFPQPCLELLRDSGVRLGSNRVSKLSSLYESGELTGDQLKYVIFEISSGAKDSFEILVADAIEKFPVAVVPTVAQTATTTGASSSAGTGLINKIKPVDLMHGGKKFGKFVRKTNGAATITLSPKTPADLLDQIESLIQTYKS